jgi:Uma2 family endonuclease
MRRSQSAESPGVAELRRAARAEQVSRMRAHTSRRWTADEVRQRLLHESWSWPRYELVDGQLLVTPAPGVAHYRAVMWLFDRLREYLDREPVGQVMLSPADLALLPETVSQPDLFVPPRSQAEAANEWSDITHLLLAVEVISPGSARNDRGWKRQHYQQARVAEYWIVDLDARLLERWRPDDDRPEIVQDRMTWQPRGAVTELVFALEDLFAASASRASSI